MISNNPYYVQPANVAGSLTGLGATYAQKVQQDREKAKDQAIRNEMVDTVENGTAEEVRAFALRNPKYAAEFNGAFTTKSDETRSNYLEMLKRARVNPEMIDQLRKSRMAFLKSQGMSDEDMEATASFKEKYDEDPEGTLKSIDNYLALNLKPDEWKQYKEAAGLDEEKQEAKTTSIKEFEYGEKNPKFKLRQQRLSDDKATKANKGKAFENSSKLRKEFLDQSKDYQKVRDSHTRVLVSTEDPSPAGDLSLIFNYMKMLDPNSVVRESEFAQAAASGSFGERFKAAGEKLLTGERLTEDMRADFVDKASVLYGGMLKQHTKREGSYKDIATKNGFDPNEIVIDLSEPAVEEVAYTEGQTATGPNGEKMVFSNGQWGTM